MEEGRSDDGPTTVDKCPTFTEMTSSNSEDSGSDFDKVAKLIAAIEKMFSCTGICLGDFKYYFYDINNGPPKYKEEGCYVRIRESID